MPHRPPWATGGIPYFPDKKIEITEDAKEVVVTVTEKAKDGNKPKVTVYKAPSGKELKTKHLEAHKLYKEHLGKNQLEPRPE